MKKIILVGLIAVFLSACGRPPERTSRAYEEVVTVNDEQKVILGAYTFEKFRLLEIEGKDLSCNALVDLEENNERYSRVFEFEFANKYSFSQCRNEIDTARQNFCEKLVEDDILKTMDRKDPSYYRDPSYGRMFNPKLHSHVCKKEISDMVVKAENKNFNEIFLKGSFVSLSGIDEIFNAKYIKKVSKPHKSAIAPFYLVKVETDSSTYLSSFANEEQAYFYIKKLSESAK